MKCFATAISTGILLYLSPLLFGANFSALVLPGTLVVFISTYLYMEATPPKNSDKAAQSSKEIDVEAVEISTKEGVLESVLPKVSLLRREIILRCY